MDLSWLSFDLSSLWNGVTTAQIPLGTILLLLGVVYIVRRVSRGAYNMVAGVFNAIIAMLPVKRMSLAASYSLATLLFVGGASSFGYGLSTAEPSNKPDTSLYVKALENKDANPEVVKAVLASADKNRDMATFSTHTVTLPSYEKPPVPSGVSIVGGLALLLCAVCLGIRTGVVEANTEDKK